VNPYFSISPKGDFVASVGPDHKIYLYPVKGGEPVLVRGTQVDEAPTGWSGDGRFLFVYRFGEVPSQVWLLELATGQRKLWRELVPADAAGIDTIRGITITPDENAYVYGYIRTLSDLYVVDGLK
jgi:Tol biopolymer transport system component